MTRRLREHLQRDGLLRSVTGIRPARGEGGKVKGGVVQLPPEAEDWVGVWMKVYRRHIARFSFITVKSQSIWILLASHTSDTYYTSNISVYV